MRQLSSLRISLVCFFFFQAEDGIRDWSVTGVQTCALPISRPVRQRDAHERIARRGHAASSDRERLTQRNVEWLELHAFDACRRHLRAGHARGSLPCDVGEAVSAETVTLPLAVPLARELA